MKLCFPVDKVSDMDSEVYGHFGSAPAFVVVDSETKAVTVIRNANQHHAPGGCNPVGSLEGHKVDAVIVGGIGGGALAKLNRAGIEIFKAEGKTVRENVELFISKKLSQFQPGKVCSGESGPCSH